MNISIHVIGSIATAGALSSGHNDDRWNVPRLASGFILGILIHGILDLLPHTYPIPSKLDVLLALLIFAVAIYFAPKRNRLLIVACFVGAVIPDVIDHSPLILQKYAGFESPRLPSKIFPWH